MNPYRWLVRQLPKIFPDAEGVLYDRVHPPRKVTYIIMDEGDLINKSHEDWRIVSTPEPHAEEESKSE